MWPEMSWLVNNYILLRLQLPVVSVSTYITSSSGWGGLGISFGLTSTNEWTKFVV